MNLIIQQAVIVYRRAAVERERKGGGADETPRAVPLLIAGPSS